MYGVIGSNSNLTEINRSAVVRILQQQEGCSRADISRKTGLTQAAITKIVAALIDLGIVSETGIITGNSNRRAIGLKLNAKKHQVIGVKFARQMFEMGVFDISGKVYDLAKIRYSAKEKPKDVLAEIKKQLYSTLNKYKNVVSIVIAVPGPYLRDEGRIAVVTQMKDWHDVNFLEEFREKDFGKPIFIEHDANAGALAEWLFGGHDQPLHSLVYFLAGDGVGSGMIECGTLLLGTQNWAEADAMFREQLEAAGFNAIVQHADNKVPQQQQQIESLIQNGAKVIVVGPIDGSQLGSVLEEAAAEGILILGYDRLIENTTGVDGIVQFGSIKTGELQGQALLQGLAELKGEGPYNIELFGGGPADPNAPSFFIGAMSVLQPKIDDGTLVVVSGQTDFTQCATLDWDNSKAQARMDSLLSSFYSDKEIHGVLSPNDGIGRAIITASENAGQKIPIVSGLDAENESVEWIWSGRQYSTVAKPTDILVGKTMEIIKSVQKGDGIPAPDTTVNNGKKEVGIYELPPVIVTKENAKEVFANDPDRLALLK